MSNSTQLALQHIKEIEGEIQTLQTRRSELVDSGLKRDQTNVGWKEKVKSLDEQIEVLMAQRDRGHTLLANKP